MTRWRVALSVTLLAVTPLAAQAKDQAGGSTEHVNPCKGHEDTCRIGEGALAIAEKKVPAIGIATNATGAATAAAEEGAPTQFEVGGKVAGVIKSGVETSKDILTSAVGRRVTGISAVEAAAMHESVEIGAKVLGPAAEVAAFCAEASRAVESCQQGHYVDATTHLTTAVAGATANAFCPGAGSTCANAAIGIGNVLADDPELSAARLNELNNPGGTEALLLERAEEQRRAADALDEPVKAAEYRRTGGTVIERGVGAAINIALPDSAWAAGTAFTPVGETVSPPIDDLVAAAVNETVASTSRGVERLEGSSRLAERGEQAFEAMRSASTEASAAVSSMISQQTQSSQQAYATQSQSQIQRNSGTGTAENCALARKQEASNKQYIAQVSAVNDHYGRQALALAEGAERETFAWIGNNCR